MRRYAVRSLPAATLALMTGVALAGTPLPNPPFTGGGFVPPDGLVYKQEASVGKIVTKYAATIAKCDAKALIGLQLGYEPANITKVPALQQAWTDCRALANTKYAAARDKLLLLGMPACLGQAGIDAIKAAVDAQFPLLGPIVYCDDDAASPDPVTGLNIPDFKNEAIGEVAASKVVTKVGLLAGKCLTKGVLYTVKLGAALPADVIAKIEACLDKVETNGLLAMDKLDQTQKLPACLPVADAKNLVTATVLLSSQFMDANYCASPSGAFLD